MNCESKIDRKILEKESMSEGHIERDGEKKRERERESCLSL